MVFAIKRDDDGEGKLKRELEEIMKRMEGLIQYRGSGADLIREIREETTGKAVQF